MENILYTLWLFVCSIFRFFTTGSLKQDVKDLSEYHPPSMKRGAKDKSLSTLDKNNESEHTPSKKSKRESSQTSSKVQSAKVRKNNDELELHASKKLKKAPLEVESLKETEEDVDIDETGPLDDDSQNSQTKKKTKKKKKKKSKQEESKVSTNHQRQRQTSDKDANKPEVANKPKEIGSGEDAVRFIEEEYAELDKKQETLQKQKTASGTQNKSKVAKGQKAKPTEEKKKEENNNKTVSHDSQRASKKEVPGKTVNNNAKSATKSDVVTDRQRERSADRRREQSAGRQRERSADRRREQSAGRQRERSAGMRDTLNEKGSEDSWDRSSSRDSKGERKEFHQQSDQRRLYSTSSKSSGGSGQDQSRKQAHNGSGQDQVKNKDQSRKQAHNGSGQDQVKNKDQGRKQAHNGSGQDQVKNKDQGRKQAHGSKSLGHVRNEPVASSTKSPGRVTKFDNYTTYFIPTKGRRDIIVNKDMAIAISEESKASKESKAELQLAESDPNYPYQKINVFGTEDERQQSIRLICEKTGIQNGFPVLIVKGDLFSCPPTESLAHCVSQDLEMGMGIAVEFKKRFHGVGDLREQRKEVGDVAVLERDRRFIYYLITKPEYFNKPNYDTLSSALEAMKHHCVENKVTRVSMPQIGCGLDKLDWDVVVECIYWAFRDTKIAITVYHL